MHRHTLVLVSALALLVPACRSPSAAGPAAPQWGREADSLGSPGTFMDAPLQEMSAAPVFDTESPAEQIASLGASGTDAGTPGLSAPRILRRGGDGEAQPARGPATQASRTAQGIQAPAVRRPGAGRASAFTFRLQVGDEISMGVWKEKELTTKQRIIPGGTFAPPLLGTVQAAGLTLDELRAVLTQRYRTYLKSPVVSVNVEGIYSDRVFVLGEVEDAQAVDLHGPSTVVQSIAMAGGFKEEFAEKRTVHLIRRGPGGKPLVYNVNACAVLSGVVTDPPLQRGDIVFVPARGVTKWARTVGQALAPISTGLVSAGAIAGTISLFNGSN